MRRLRGEKIARGLDFGETDICHAQLVLKLLVELLCRRFGKREA